MAHFLKKMSFPLLHRSMVSCQTQTNKHCTFSNRFELLMTYDLASGDHFIKWRFVNH